MREEAVIVKRVRHAPPQIGKRDRLRVRRGASAGVEEVADAVVAAVLYGDEDDFALEFINYFFIERSSEAGLDLVRIRECDEERVAAIIHLEHRRAVGRAAGKQDLLRLFS